MESAEGEMEAAASERSDQENQIESLESEKMELLGRAEASEVRFFRAVGV